MQFIRQLVRLLPIAALLTLLPTPVSAQEYDGLVQSSLYVESFDGTRIAISIFRPTSGGAPAAERLPVIVTQNRGEVNERLIAEMRRFTDYGYVWIAQDRRGTGASFGRQTGFVNRADAADAKAVIEWSAGQGFSSGRTVAYGCSNQGAWQYLVATMQPASLVAIAPSCASPMFYDDAVAIGGVPMFGLTDTAYAGACREGQTPGARPDSSGRAPSVPVDGDDDGTLLAAAREEQQCGSWMLGQYALGQPRDQVNAFVGYAPALGDVAMTEWEALRDSGIAVLQVGGWFDAATLGQIEGQRVFGGRLIMGPWVHGNRPAPGTDFPNAAFDLATETREFFDVHAKGIGSDNRPAIIYYSINATDRGGEWHNTERWSDLPRTPLYLEDDGALAPIALRYTGAEILAAGGARWFDGRYMALGRWFAGDFAATNEGSLLHTAAPVERDLEITGTPTAELWITADQADVNVYAMLQDVAPDGSATYITDGRLRASWRAEHDLPWPGATRIWHRGNAADLAPLVPGEPALLRFDFFPVSWVLREGHSLRLAITTGIGLAYDAPPLAGGQPVTLTVHTGMRYPSAISLPAAEY